MFEKSYFETKLAQQIQIMTARQEVKGKPCVTITLTENANYDVYAFVGADKLLSFIAYADPGQEATGRQLVVTPFERIVRVRVRGGDRPFFTAGENKPS